MKPEPTNLEIISAPSILGLKPTGVEELGASLLAAGLAGQLQVVLPVRRVPTLNSQFSFHRDPETQCLNPVAIRDFSRQLAAAVSASVEQKRFALVLGGDCSILLGIMPALKAKGDYGLIFLDAHADFYEPEKSTTGEVADMDLAIVTGRGPEILTKLDSRRPYVPDEHVIHVGQRDAAETKKYGSQDIRDTAIHCFDLAMIEQQGICRVLDEILVHVAALPVQGFWLHFDTDVLSDEVNPAVDYRLPGGLQFAQVEALIGALLATGRMVGLSVTIFNPRLDPDGHIAAQLSASLARAFAAGK